MTLAEGLLAALVILAVVGGPVTLVLMLLERLNLFRFSLAGWIVAIFVTVLTNNHIGFSGLLIFGTPALLVLWWLDSLKERENEL